MNFLKDPGDVLDYQFDWSSWLNEDTILSSRWTMPEGITEDSSTNDTTTATIWLSSGTLAEDYEVTNQVVTAGGRTAERSMTIKVRSR